jgi:hypothetical protein
MVYPSLGPRDDFSSHFPIPSSALAPGSRQRHHVHSPTCEISICSGRGRVDSNTMALGVGNVKITNPIDESLVHFEPLVWWWCAPHMPANRPCEFDRSRPRAPLRNDLWKLLSLFRKLSPYSRPFISTVTTAPHFMPSDILALCNFTARAILL